MISRDKHMNKLHESKCLNVKSGQETTGFFPVVSMCWHTPLIYVVTLTKSLVTSHVTKTRVLTKGALTIPAWWSSSHIQSSSCSHNQLGKLRKEHLNHQDCLGDANHQE